MKKITYALLAPALFSSIASAHVPPYLSNPATCANFSGFYVGALFGYGFGKGKTNVIFTEAGVTDAFDLSPHMGGVNGGFVFGYGRAMANSKIYAGLDFSFTFDGSKGKSTDIEICRKDSLETAIRFGLILGNAMPFVKFVWANSKIEGKDRQFFTQKFINKRLNGFGAGLGMDMKLTQYIIVGLDYSYIAFSKSGELIHVDVGVPIDNNNNVNTKTKLSENKIRIKISYQF